MGHAAVNFSMDCDEDDELGFVIQNCINSWDHDGISDPPNGDTFEDIKMSGKHHVLVYEFVNPHVPQNMWKVHSSHLFLSCCFY